MLSDWRTISGALAEPPRRRLLTSTSAAAGAAANRPSATTTSAPESRARTAPCGAGGLTLHTCRRRRVSGPRKWAPSWAEGGAKRRSALGARRSALGARRSANDVVPGCQHRVKLLEAAADVSPLRTTFRTTSCHAAPTIGSPTESRRACFLHRNPGRRHAGTQHRREPTWPLVNHVNCASERISENA